MVWGSQIPCTLHKTRKKKMDKKFYEMPEVEVINLQIEGALLDGSDPNIGDDGEAGKGSGEGGSEDF